MGIIKEVFGHDSHGEKVYSYTVTNEHGTRMRVIEIGAALQSLEVADRDGNLQMLSLALTMWSSMRRKMALTSALLWDVMPIASRTDIS